MINLYVDDLRDCPKGFIVARNMEEAIDYIENNEVNILSLDHDLGADNEGNILPTGYDLVKYFCENGLHANKVYIHTDNGVGRENMFQTLKVAQRRGFIARDIGMYHYSITPNTYTE
ncbi:cyclic-phosphate processing receiver domain-containing protein [Virgibacillus soli]|uniref:Cyclic-phosphate processing receiver domain-containing protein n=1 Tax=Paracerasibacillus soli TaxID=480284 RepID=A0ABU5CWD9_9BACI|nr:cyclic-phosphate processing receiver domain-containing protein [Virgibacillus soli]MDY0410144.1 cyclic-phosphate processing receiver domain-containing protein [Virgibacillus soli]